MTLPEFALQAVYGRLSWAIVLAAAVAALLPATLGRRRPAIAAVLGSAGLLLAFSGERSVAYWLGLTFQYPSGLLTLLCLFSLFARWRGTAPGALIPRSLVAPLALAGTVLYLDAMGVLALGLYYAGFGPLAAPLLALCGAAACALALGRGRGGRQHAALLGALVLFSLLRLPSGNLWDAVLDPLLWAWAVVAAVRQGLRLLARSRARRAAAGDEVFGTGDLAPDVAVVQVAAPVESFSLSKLSEE